VSEEWYDKCPVCGSEAVNSTSEIGGFKVRVSACPICDFYDWEIPDEIMKRGDEETERWVSETDREAKRAAKRLLREHGFWFKIEWTQPAMDLLDTEQRKLIDSSVKEILRTLGGRRAYICKFGSGLKIECRGE